MKRTDQKGVALLMVIVAVAILAIVSVELIYTIGVDHKLGRNLTDGLRAYYLSKSAARFSLWRIRSYMAAQKKFNENPENGFFTQKDVDLLWNLPLPPLPFDLSKLEISSADKSQTEKFQKESKTVGKFFSSIQAEGKKINLNLLSGMPDWGSSEEIQKLMRTLLIAILEQDYYADENFQERNPDFKAEDAIDAIIDYVDGNRDPQENQPQEDTYYESLDPSQKSKNLPLYTLDELRMVRLWEGELFDRFSDQFTVFPNSFYFNVNQVEKQIFDAFVRMQERTPHEDDLAKFMSDRGQLPFKDSNDFIKRFEDSFGVKPPEKLRYVVNDRTFIINAFGESGGARQKQTVAVRLESRPVAQEDCDTKPNPTDKQKCEDEKAKRTNNPPLDFMRIIYWKEEII